MRYILTSGWDDGLADLTQQLVRELGAAKHVLWLVSGGSNVRGSVQVMHSIPATLVKNLTVLLIDERYGPVGHADSNYQQLQKAGFRPGNATFSPVLQADLGFEATVKQYRKTVAEAFRSADVIIAQLGIGDDGHIAGILPDSSASREAKQLVSGYKSKPFERITLTFPALQKVTAAYVFAFGAGKFEALNRLRTRRLGLEQQPAQILKQLKQAYLYNDQVGK